MKPTLVFVITTLALALLVGCQTTPEVVTEPAASSEGPEEKMAEKATKEEDDRTISPPWRASTTEESGLCGAAGPLPQTNAQGCELSGPWRGKLGQPISGETRETLTEALEACAKDDRCGGVGADFATGVAWALLSKSSISFRLDKSSYGCTVLIRCNASEKTPQ